MTRNQKIAVEILEMLDSKVNASVEYYAESDKVTFWHHYNRTEKTVGSVDINEETVDAEAQEKFDGIKSIIREFKNDAN